MALENQPVLRAPSIPKMGKNTFSSPFKSSATKITSAVKGPKLKASKMSFVRGIKPFGAKPESLRSDVEAKEGGEGSISSTLSETNLILVEIQKQLALDFANRISERKSELAAEKKKIRAKKLKEKEQFVEKGKGLGSGIKSFTTKALQPIKSIFDKILEFLALVGTGMLINSVWEWLQDKENRDKLIEVFTFLKTYWKEILATLIGIKLIGALTKLIGIANTLRKIFKALRGGGKGPGGGGGPCGPVLQCAPQLATAIVAALSAAALALLGKKLVDSGSVAPPGLVAPPVTAPALPFQDIYDLGNNPILRPLADIGNSREFQIASLLTALGVAGVGVALPEPATTTGGLAAIGPILAKLKLLMSAPKLALAGGVLSLTPMMAMAKDKGIEIPENEVAGQIVQYFGKTKDELLKIYKDKNATPVERIAAERTLIEQYNVKLDPPEFSRGGIIPGTPSMQDTVHALLAKGEFVINSMSTKMFKPFLYAINNNAGRIFKQFVEGVNNMKQNASLTEELTLTQFSIVKKLNEHIEKMVEREQEKKRKELEEGSTGGSRGGSRTRRSVKTVSRKVPKSIQTYRRGRGGPASNSSSGAGEGTQSVVSFNVTQPALNLAGQETPEPVPTEPTERAEETIRISSTDSSNPYIVNSYVNYGIDV